MVSGFQPDELPFFDKDDRFVILVSDPTPKPIFPVLGSCSVDLGALECRLFFWAGMWFLQVGVQGSASTPMSPKSEPYGRRAEGSDIPRGEGPIMPKMADVTWEVL